MASISKPVVTLLEDQETGLNLSGDEGRILWKSSHIIHKQIITTRKMIMLSIEEVGN